MIDEKKPKIGEWIPVSERLPDNGRWVLITDNFESFTTDLKPRRYILVMIGYYEDSEWWLANGDCTENVTAWMELPEPYRGEENDRRKRDETFKDTRKSTSKNVGEVC